MDGYDTKKFAYGLDADVYYEKALEILKNRYHWASKDMMRKDWRYAIEKENGEYQYVSYFSWSRKNIERKILDDIDNAEDFIKKIVDDNDYEVFGANPVVDKYEVKYEPRDIGGGWYLERYEFQRLQTGDYCCFVQAGDRYNGGSRSFYIPPVCLDGTYDEFLEKYQKIVPGDSFGLYKEDLIDDEGLKKFLGFEGDKK